MKILGQAVPWGMRVETMQLKMLKKGVSLVNELNQQKINNI